MSDDEDDLGFVIRTRPSERRQMPDDELMRNYRKSAIANRHPFSAMLEREMQARVIATLKSFKVAADRSSRTLNVLTLVLVVRTVVLVVYPIRAGVAGAPLRRLNPQAARTAPRESNGCERA